jgi:hypothetical protein
MSLLDATDLFAQAYCLTLVRGLGVDQTFARLGADLGRSTTTGFCGLVGSAYEDCGGGIERQLAGAAQLDGWTLLLEPNGYACTGKKRMRKVSRRTTTVTLYRHLDAAQELSVNADGKRLVTLDLAAHEPGNEAPGTGHGAVLVEHFTGVRLTVDLLGRLRYRTGTLDNR